MHLHTFKARSLAEALRLVRENLGPDASVLQTREVGGMFTRWLGQSEIEVTASTRIHAPSRMPPAAGCLHVDAGECNVPPADLHDFRRKFRENLKHAESSASIIEGLCR